MPKNTITYKGFSSTVDFDAEQCILTGSIIGIDEEIVYKSKDCDELIQYFEDAVDAYMMKQSKKDTSTQNNEPYAVHIESEAKYNISFQADSYNIDSIVDVLQAHGVLKEDIQIDVVAESANNDAEVHNPLLADAKESQAVWRNCARTNNVSSFSCKERQLFALDGAMHLLMEPSEDCVLLHRMNITGTNFDCTGDFIGTPYDWTDVDTAQLFMDTPVFELAQSLFGLDAYTAKNLHHQIDCKQFSISAVCVFNFIFQEIDTIVVLWESEHTGDDVLPYKFYTWAKEKGFILPQKGRIALSEHKKIVLERSITMFCINRVNTYCRYGLVDDRDMYEDIGERKLTAKEYVDVLKARGTTDPYELAWCVDEEFSGKDRLEHHVLGELLPARSGTTIGSKGYKSRGVRLRGNMRPPRISPKQTLKK